MVGKGMELWLIAAHGSRKSRISFPANPVRCTCILSYKGQELVNFLGILSPELLNCVVGFKICKRIEMELFINV